MTYKEVAAFVNGEWKMRKREQEIIQEFRCDLFCEYKIMKLTLQQI